MNNLRRIEPLFWTVRAISPGFESHPSRERAALGSTKISLARYTGSVALFFRRGGSVTSGTTALLNRNIH